MRPIRGLGSVDPIGFVPEDVRNIMLTEKEAAVLLALHKQSNSVRVVFDPDEYPRLCREGLVDRGKDDMWICGVRGALWLSIHGLI